MVEEKKYTCAKCGKEKSEAEGAFVLEGSTYCCKECCGDSAKMEHKDKAAQVCEFC